MIKITCDEPDEMLKLACQVVQEKMNKWAELKVQTQYGKLEVVFFPHDVTATLEPSYRTKLSRDPIHGQRV
jgi:hypothetical protein